MWYTRPRHISTEDRIQDYNTISEISAKQWKWSKQLSESEEPISGFVILWSWGGQLASLGSGFFISKTVGLNRKMSKASSNFKNFMLNKVFCFELNNCWIGGLWSTLHVRIFNQLICKWKQAERLLNKLLVIGPTGRDFNPPGNSLVCVFI